MMTNLLCVFVQIIHMQLNLLCVYGYTAHKFSWRLLLLDLYLLMASQHFAIEIYSAVRIVQVG